MASVAQPAFKQQDKDKERKIYGVFIKSVLSQKVILSITEIGANIKKNLEKKLVQKNEGKCIVNGYIRPNSIRIISYSSGNVNSEFIEFQTVFECMCCHPVEGQLIECVSKTITKAGIHAEVMIDNIVPITVFIARDHHNTNKYFATIKENARLTVRVIGVRFELNDPYISVIAQLLEPQESRPEQKDKARQKAGLARLTIYEDEDNADFTSYQEDDDNE